MGIFTASRPLHLHASVWQKIFYKDPKNWGKSATFRFLYFNSVTCNLVNKLGWHFLHRGCLNSGFGSRIHVLPLYLFQNLHWTLCHASLSINQKVFCKNTSILSYLYSLFRCSHKEIIFCLHQRKDKWGDHQTSSKFLKYNQVLDMLLGSRGFLADKTDNTYLQKI